MIMSNKTIPVITISREYEAGGRSVARGLSEKLGIPWYDKDFMKLTAKNSGYSVEDIEKEGEEISGFGKALDSVLNSVSSYTSSHDAIFDAQKKVMLDLAKEPCIIVGRCGNAILREAGVPSFDVFLFADKEVRAERAKAAVPDMKEDPMKYVEKIDSKRQNYYKAYTKHSIGQAQDYNICLDTGLISYENCVELIIQILQ